MNPVFLIPHLRVGSDHLKLFLRTNKMAKPSQLQQPGVSAQRATPPDLSIQWTILTGSQPRKYRTCPQPKCCDPCGIGWVPCFSGGVARTSLTPGCCGWDGFAILVTPTRELVPYNGSKPSRS